MYEIHKIMTQFVKIMNVQRNLIIGTVWKIEYTLKTNYF